MKLQLRPTASKENRIVLDASADKEPVPIHGIFQDFHHDYFMSEKFVQHLEAASHEVKPYIQGRLILSLKSLSMGLIKML